MIWYVQVQYYYTLGLSLKFNPRLVISQKFRYHAPKTGAFTTRALLSRNYNARKNSLQLPNPDTRNPPSNPEPKGPLVQIGGGYFCNTPYILDKRVPKSWFPLPSPPFCHLKSQAAITSPLQPRNPTLLRPPPHHCPAGASSPTTLSTATARRPSSTSSDEDPSSISPSRRFSRPVLHLQGAAPTIASSIAAAPSPQCRPNLLHRNRSIRTDSSDEAEAYSAPPKRLYTHRIAPSP